MRQTQAQEKLLVIACGALAKEIVWLQKANGWQQFDLQCLDAELHNRPKLIPEKLRLKIEQNRQKYQHIFVAYADCGTGGMLQRLCDRLGIKMVQGPHCYSFFEGNDAFAAQDEIYSFYLTDFLVRQFDAFVVKPLGLDRHPELRDMYFGNYKSLVYQAQTDDPALTELAKQHAERLGLTFERRLTGYGDLATALAAKA